MTGLVAGRVSRRLGQKKNRSAAIRGFGPATGQREKERESSTRALSSIIFVTIVNPIRHKTRGGCSVLQIAIHPN